MKKIFLLLIIFIFSSSYVFADGYVLPYPSAMPGSIWYKLDLVKESVGRIWYFGNFGHFYYSLKESDKYLVEAKTLFEYDQFLLGYQALKKSDGYFEQTLPSLSSASKQGEDITNNRQLLRSAAIKHIQVLSKLLREVPETVNWKPENQKATVLQINDALNNSIFVREKYL